MSGQTATEGGDVILKGTCDVEYQSVKDLFRSHLKTGKDENAQLCVYVGGKRVVDLWGSSIGDDKFGPDDLQLVFSSAKSVESFLVALMVERGLLDYEAKVCKYWPEFGQAGKEDMTLADVLRHEAGLTTFGEPIGVEDTLPDNIKENAMGKVIEQSEPTWATNYLNKDGTPSKRAYHGMSRGHIINEIIRRVDPSGRTMGQILREDVGIPGIRCGLLEDELRQVAPQKMMTLTQSFMHEIRGRGYMKLKELLTLMFTLIFIMIPKAIFKKTKPLYKEKMKNLFPFVSTEQFRKTEAMSFNAHASARGLATLAAILAEKGSPPEGSKSQRLISEETYNKMHADPKKARDAEIFGMVTNFTQGGVNVFTAPKNPRLADQHRDGYVGWMGLGGSVFQWHPELKIGFSYVPGFLQTFDFMNMRGSHLQGEVKKCAQNLQKNL